MTDKKIGELRESCATEPQVLDEVERLQRQLAIADRALQEMLAVATVDFFELHEGAADRVCHLREIADKALTARELG